MRDFIQQSLYHPTKGYFNRSIPVVGTLASPINFWGIYCRDEFNTHIKKQYDDLQVSFLTPAELFTPWYGYIMARHMSEHRTHVLRQANDVPMAIMEIGGGNGTLARDILDWTRDNRPEVYATMSYTCLEISTRLSAQQYDTVVVRGGHGARFHMVQGNAWDRAAWGTPDYQHTFILMMEVLDNLPHDRVFRPSSAEPWQQTVVAASGPSVETGPWTEEGEALDDELMARCLAATYQPSTLEQRMDGRFNRTLDWLLGIELQRPMEGEVLFLPTACLSLLDTLQSVRPNHSLIAADFDMLPDVRVAGKNAPLVAEKIAGQKVDHDTILVPWGTADIFFPTDFAALAALYKASAQHVWGKDKMGIVEGVHYRQGEVTKRYREMAKTATICAFNPMVDDFLNARLFFGDSRGRRAPGDAPPALPPVTRRELAPGTAPQRATLPPPPGAGPRMPDNPLSTVGRGAPLKGGRAAGPSLLASFLASKPKPRRPDSPPPLVPPGGAQEVSGSGRGGSGGEGGGVAQGSGGSGSSTSGASTSSSQGTGQAGREGAEPQATVGPPSQGLDPTGPSVPGGLPRDTQDRERGGT